jgi:hypothetical protein
VHRDCRVQQIVHVHDREIGGTDEVRVSRWMGAEHAGEMILKSIRARQKTEVIFELDSPASSILPVRARCERGLTCMPA